MSDQGLRTELRGNENKQELYIAEGFDNNFHFITLADKNEYRVLKSVDFGRWFTIEDKYNNKYIIKRRLRELARSGMGLHVLKPGEFMITDISFLDGTWYVMPKLREQHAEPMQFKITGNYTITKKDLEYEHLLIENKIPSVNTKTNSLLISFSLACMKLLTKEIDYTSPEAQLPANLYIRIPEKLEVLAHPQSFAWELPMHIINRGEQILKWQGKSDAAWLTIGPSHGRVKNGGEFFANCKVNAQGLKSGIYTGKLRIEATAATNAPKIITVKLKMLKPSDPIPDSEPKIIRLIEK